MDKIKDLLVKAGCKTDLVNAIAESLENYKTDLRSRFGTEYAVKVEKAKKVCVEETEAHKRELARRLQIFCETKSAAIEAQLTKMSALSESQATAKLKNVRALLEGVQLNGKQDGRSAAAVEKAQRRIQQLTEEKNKAIAEANRKTAIAEKALKANRSLVTENAKLTELSRPTISESRPVRKLQAPRQMVKPATTRATLLESQDRRPVVRSANPNTISKPTGGFSVTDIAATMDEDLI
jgi:hypothetical protein